MLTRDTMERIALRWKLNVTRPISTVSEFVNVGIFLAVAVLVFLISQSGQGREIFRAVLEAPEASVAEIVLAALFAFMLSGILFFAYRVALPAYDAFTRLERFASGVRLAGPYVLAIAPWIGAGLSVYYMKVDLDRAVVHLKTELSAVGQSYQTTAAREWIERIDANATPAILIISCGAALTLLLLALLDYYNYRTRLIGRMATALNVSALIVLGVVGVVAAVSNATFVEEYQYMGPLAVGIVTTISLFALGLFVSFVSRAFGLTTLAGIVALVALYAIAALLVSHSAVEPDDVADQTGRSGKNSESGLPSPPSFAEQAAPWLSALAQNAGTERPPVFVVSAQGGGMYAATLSSLFLTRMQDRDANFHRHLFAISSVSGGSVGAGFYHALMTGHACGSQTAAVDGSSQNVGKLEAKIRELILQPYLAPVVGNLTADILRKAAGTITYPVDRSDALAQSLIKVCPALDAIRFKEHWSPKSVGPALILNTTWMRNGHRVAFAPYALKEIGDGTLWSFSDIYSGRMPNYRGKSGSPHLADAIVASARFPGILPPLSIRVQVPDGNGRQVWHTHNFGDGGYADASGVTTALEILRKLDAINVYNSESYLVVLSFGYAGVNPENQDGTWFVDTRAPVSAVLGVRENLAAKAVERARRGREGQSGRVLQVQIRPEDYGIALGWRLSRSSYEILSLLIGRAEWCPEEKLDRRDREGGDKTSTILANSCTAKRVLETIRGS